MHSFDSHSAQWFGRSVSARAGLAQWAQLIERVSKSSLQVEWTQGNRAAIGHLSRIDGKYIFAVFWKEGPDAGELATAFVPKQAQLSTIMNRLK